MTRGQVMTIGMKATHLTKMKIRSSPPMMDSGSQLGNL